MTDAQIMAEAVAREQEIIRLKDRIGELTAALELARGALSTRAWYAESYYVRSGDYKRDHDAIDAALKAT